MNPDVTENITATMSELQLQFLQHLKIQPLQTYLTAPDFQPALTVSIEKQQPEPAFVPEIPRQWLTADASMPLVQDLLCCLQQAGVTAQWYYQADTSDIHFTGTGLYSAAPQSFQTAERKKQLWQHVCLQLPAEETAVDTATTDPT